MKHLQYYLDTANDASRKAKYAGFINAQASGVVHYATGSGYNVGSVWYGPNQGGFVFSPKTQASGLAALVSAAKVCALQPTVIQGPTNYERLAIRPLIVHDLLRA